MTPALGLFPAAGVSPVVTLLYDSASASPFYRAFTSKIKLVGGKKEEKRKEQNMCNGNAPVVCAVIVVYRGTLSVYGFVSPHLCNGGVPGTFALLHL